MSATLDLLLHMSAHTFPAMCVIQAALEGCGQKTAGWVIYRQ